MSNEELITEDGSIIFPSMYDTLVNKGDIPHWLQIKRLEDHPVGESWCLLYYGPSGAGKTYFCGTAGPRSLFINIGNGIDTLKSPAFTSRYPDASKMLIVDITEKLDATGKDQAQAFDMITDAIDYGLTHLKDDWDTCILDDATFMRRTAMNKAIKMNAAAAKSARKSDLKDFIPPEVQDYGREMQIIEWFLQTYIPIMKQHKKNFIMTAHERQIYGKPQRIGDEAPLLKVLPGFTGKTFPDSIPAYFDDVFHAEVVGGGSNVVYRARTSGDETLTGKSRHGGIFKTVESDPNFLKMLSQIKEKSK